MYRSLDDRFWGTAWLRSIDASKSPAGTYWLLAPEALHVGKDSMVHQHTPPQKTISFQKMMDFAFPMKAPNVTPTVLTVKPRQKIVNPYKLFEEINAGQQVEKTTLSSYLGSCAHWYASYVKKSNQTKEENAYAKLIPAICKQMGESLLKDTGTLIYNERDVYWPSQLGPRDDKKYVHSRVDMVTKDGEEYHVWEFKTKWGNWNKKVANMDYTQAVVYAHMLRKSNVKISKVHIRYITHEDGQLVLTTFSFPINSRTIFDLKWK